MPSECLRFALDLQGARSESLALMPLKVFLLAECHLHSDNQNSQGTNVKTSSCQQEVPKGWCVGNNCLSFILKEVTKMSEERQDETCSKSQKIKHRLNIR